ncbi:gamma carbonic anhydrase family protein [Glaciibacter psychrotolerans]|uniref:Carbonic anhydrase/acetyltransferase-like protein (Isoleucine patch superfamily) n=1 Tax=Glaciibacter psychrotolerans TaxID=670054 RepID=A0A7Z0J7U9_9MICO|nr:gamma carbonic anhydrase family protein [Leifsonia psychrotolerans]NYJ21681.1 carbonic anhydrase/acetyltransferase-like protein (isoleucine patch superfamily) [Leifsonia psychrotolerans]
MTVDSSARLITLPNLTAPVVAETAFVAAGAVLVGQVSLGDQASVWYNAVVRAEAEPIVIGAGSNLQDNVSCHVDGGFPLTLGRNVSVGHGAVLHGCTIGDDVLVGMSATIMNGAVIGTGSLVAAGALVLEGTVVPPGSLVAGVPAKVRRELTDDEIAGIRHNATAYLAHSALHAHAAV